MVRAEGQTATIADASWLGDFLLECALFPKGRHDDQVDALAQGLQYIRERLQEPFFLAYAKEEMAKRSAGPTRGLVRMMAPPGVNEYRHIDGRIERIQNGYCDVPAKCVYGLEQGGWKMV